MFDIWDMAANTETIKRSMLTLQEQSAVVGPRIAPLVSVQDRKLKRTVEELNAFGKGQFKARNATPPLFTPSIRVTQDYIELALLEEMTEIEEDEWHDLTSPDEKVRNRVGVDIMTRARMLQIRNERLTEWMRWQAFQDNLVITLPDNPANTYKLVYGQPATHRPTVATSWTNRAASTPISNLRTWQRLISRAIGHLGLDIYMNSDTYEELEYSDEVKTLISTPEKPEVPRREQIEARLYGGANAGTEERYKESPQIIVTDAGYRDVGAGDDRSEDAVTYYIPDGYVLITSRPVIEGERIADVADGRVAVTTGGGPPLVWKQGMQSEVMYDLKAKTHFWRQASARIPRIHRPRAFVYAKVFLP